ncbi:MAG: hypothetical protein B7Z74_11040, partial [Deltaproteobacteria bacterium 21-66-5]
PDPVRGLATLSATAGMTLERLDRRLKMLEEVQGASGGSLRGSAKVEDYLRVMAQARAMMDSPVKLALDYVKQERAATIAAYEPQITAEQVKDKKYYFGRRFGHGLLVARRLVEAGARFVQVEYQYGAFKGFDTHEDGSTRIVELKKQVDGPLAQLIRDLADFTVVVNPGGAGASRFGARPSVAIMETEPGIPPRVRIVMRSAFSFRSVISRLPSCSSRRSSPSDDGKGKPHASE